MVAKIKAIGKESKPDRKFVLWTHLFGPHSTYMDHPEFPVGKGFKFIKERYDAEVSFTDVHIGKMLAALAEAGLSEDTAVVVFSDHGEAFGEHKLSGEPLYFHGESLYNEVLKVPLIVSAEKRGSHRGDCRSRATYRSGADAARSVGRKAPASVPRSIAAALLKGDKLPAPLPAIAEMLPCTAWPKMSA